ncbi:MAG TPA: TIGR03013 family XrtA/PEP-CTERM system glycosyltransferase [Steroidobacteraceae bacterium]|nr:TIGR03013 family XrtA/PEP-CTERM system glycosyltransferase [Steroidobacteraceae bacterium]
MRIRVLGQSVPVSIAVIALVEGALSFLAVYAAALIRFPAALAAPQRLERELGPLWPGAVLLSAVVVACMLAFGLYSARQRAQSAGILVRVLAALTVASCIVAAAFYVIPSLRLTRDIAALAVILAGCGLLASRLLLVRYVDENMFKRQVLVYGAGAGAAAIASLRRSADRRAFALVGFIQPPGEARAVPVDRVLEPAGDLSGLCDRLSVTEVVVAMDDRRNGFPIRELLDCRLAGIEVTELLTFLERETGRVRIDVLNPSWMIFGQGFRRDPLRLFSSRALDLLASLALLPFALPVMLLTVVAIKLEDGWRAPAVYTQARVGLGGHIFRVIKFRSMREDAETHGAQWAQRHDPRTTRVGAVIRKLRIDELPQIINVLRGQMSFVGPRPERPEFVAQLSEKIPYYAQRQCVRPGLTGWAQLCYHYGSSEQDALEKLQYDLFYIKNNSLLFDLTILVQTAEVVLLGKGAR